MKIFMIRHADALPLGEMDIVDDDLRPLSEEGREQARLLGEWMRDHGHHPRALVSSPYLRAKQTAEILLPILGLSADKMVISEEMAPAGKSRKLAKVVRGLDAQSVALIGHLPDVSMHMGWFTGTRKIQVRFAKAGIACVETSGELEKGCGELLWYIPPDVR